MGEKINEIPNETIESATTPEPEIVVPQYPVPPKYEQIERRRNVPALVGMIISIASFQFFFFPPVQTLTAIVGLIMSIIGVAKPSSKFSGKGMAIAGIIIAAVGIVFSIMVLFFLLMLDGQFTVSPSEIVSSGGMEMLKIFL